MIYLIHIIKCCVCSGENWNGFLKTRGGANMVYPDYFEEYRDFIPLVSVSIYTLIAWKST